MSYLPNTKQALLAAVIAVAAAVPSHAWVRVGFRGGWGPRVGVAVGPGPWWYGPYDPYYPAYDPYAYPYDPYYAPYAAPAQQQAAPETMVPDNFHNDLRYLNSQIAQARSDADYAYQDGDISQGQYDAEMNRLTRIQRDFREEAKENNGTLTNDQGQEFLAQIRGAPPSVAQRTRPARATPPGQGIAKVQQEFVRVRGLLDRKLSGSSITMEQHDRMADYLDRLEKQVSADASATGGSLAPDKETAVLEQLHRAESNITKNFVYDSAQP